MKTKLICRSTFHGSRKIVVDATDLKLNPRQLRKLRRGLCGMNDCTCGAPFQHTEIRGRGNEKYWIEQVTSEGCCEVYTR